MKVSIIISTWNQCSALMRTLQSLDSVSVPPGLFVEVVVVDNGSTDETPSELARANLKRCGLRCVRESRRGKAHALNTGLNVARGEIIALTDDDVRPAPTWLKGIADPIIDEHFDAIAGEVLIAPHLLRNWMTDTHRAWLASTHYLDPVEPEAALGANMAFSREVLRKVRGFDPELGPGRLGFWEDTLFSLQLRHAGYRLGMARQASVEHHFDPSRLSRNAFLRRANCEGQSSAYVAWHWQHAEHSNASRCIRRYRVLLALKRICRWRDWQQSEGIAEWELNLVAGIAFAQQYLIERRRPRAYHKWGAEKLAA
jgi:glycosyltransferase involved in cell wall biosynthesis